MTMESSHRLDQILEMVPILHGEYRAERANWILSRGLTIRGHTLQTVSGASTNVWLKIRRCYVLRPIDVWSDAYHKFQISASLDDGSVSTCFVKMFGLEYFGRDRYLILRVVTFSLNALNRASGVIASVVVRAPNGKIIRVTHPWARALVV